MKNKALILRFINRRQLPTITKSCYTYENAGRFWFKVFTFPKSFVKDIKKGI